MIMKKPTTEAIMDALFSNASVEDIVHLTYYAGEPPTAVAEAQYQAATDWKKGPHDYVGHFVSYRITKNGDPLLTLWVHNRGETGAYRSFNPRLGKLINMFVRKDM